MPMPVKSAPSCRGIKGLEFKVYSWGVKTLGLGFKALGLEVFNSSLELGSRV